MECGDAGRDSYLQGNGDGDLRILVRARSKTDDGHFDSKETFNHGEERWAAGNTRKDVILQSKDTDRRRPSTGMFTWCGNEQAVNIDMLIVGELRVLTGLGRQRGA